VLFCSLEDQNFAADADSVSISENTLFNPSAVHERSIRAIRVADPGETIFIHDPGMRPETASLGISIRSGWSLPIATTCEPTANASMTSEPVVDGSRAVERLSGPARSGTGEP